MKQATTLFGATHYRDYHFLYTLSDHVAHFGLEHHEANDSRTEERTLIDPQLRVLHASLLTHEYVHSWNGKYRRPADLTTSDYQQVMRDDLLWVYEGLTEYLGDVLAARSGLWNPEQYRDNLAHVVAGMDHHTGRSWRNLQDSADAASELYYSPHQWESWRRSTDFYDGQTPLFASNRRARNRSTISAICFMARPVPLRWSRPTHSTMSSIR